MRKGSITVFLALTLSVMCSLITAAVESARVSAMRMQIETSVDLALDSVFAEYSRELLDRYDLFFIDASYGGKNPSVYNVEKRLREYLEYNLEPAVDSPQKSYADYFQLRADDVLLDRISLAADEGGAVFRRQAVSYMKDKTGLDVLEKVLHDSQEIKRHGIGSRDIEAEREEIKGKIRDVHIPPRQVGEDKWEEVTVQNPADEVDETRGGGILELVTRGDVSTAAVNIGDLASHRPLESGIGPAGEKAGEGVVDGLLFDEYIVDKFSSYRERKNDLGLHYEMEYILEGKENDADNLDAVVKKLLLLRETANVIFLLADAGKNSEAEALALAVAGFVGMPYLTQLIKMSILFAWGYAESVVDMKTLLAGGRVPIMKSGEDWKVSIGSLLSFRSLDGDGEGEGRGLSYGDYLKIFLLFQDMGEKTLRCLDIIEVNLREVMNDAFFRTDACIEYLEVQVGVSSGYGYGYTIRRSYGYLCGPLEGGE